jgi:hypothetical protein
MADRMCGSPNDTAPVAACNGILNLTIRNIYNIY